MNAKKNAFVSVFISCIAFISFIALTSCGGTECSGADCTDPTDNIVVVDDSAQPDEDLVDNEPVDNELVDKEQTDDVQTDNIQPDDDSVLTEEEPDQDQVVTANCEKLLDIVGNWSKVGEDRGLYLMTLTVTPRVTDCEVLVLWTKGFSGEEKWYGLELPLQYWNEEGSRFMILKKDGEFLVRADADTNGNPVGGEWAFEKIQ